jgi:aminoglycoside 6'-N-acetyltransferase
VVELKGDRVLLRPLRVDDVPVLVEIQAQPSVARWWGPPDEEDLRRQAEGKSEETSFAITVDGAVAGLIQYAEENEPMYRHAGIDLFLAEEFQGRGLGTDAVRTLARHLVQDRDHHRLTIDPSADNHAAIRAYEKVGFKPVGVMRQYERSPEGGWRDGLLMDLLADELA